MSEVVEVLFKGEERELFSNPTPVILRPGNFVIVEADKGEDMGRVILKGMWVSKKAREAPVRKIVRKATKEDLERREANLEKEIEAFQVCRDRIEERELKMKLVDVECRFDGNRITFYFTAEKRVDFRELVKDLAAIYRTRIELRQIGVRDEAKRIGGFGSCGRKFCCTTFLREFEPVTLKMAKEQHLSLSPTKISGACGRLMCCLMYEVDTYRRCLESYPKVGSKIQMDGQEMQVTRVDIFREGVFVQDPEGGEDYVSLEELLAKRRKRAKEDTEGEEVNDDGRGAGSTDEVKSAGNGGRGRGAAVADGDGAAGGDDRSRRQRGDGEETSGKAPVESRDQRGKSGHDRAKGRSHSHRNNAKGGGQGREKRNQKPGGHESGSGKPGKERHREPSGENNRGGSSGRSGRRWRGRDKRHG